MLFVAVPLVNQYLRDHKQQTDDELHMSNRLSKCFVCGKLILQSMSSFNPQSTTDSKKLLSSKKLLVLEEPTMIELSSIMKISICWNLFQGGLDPDISSPFSCGSTVLSVVADRYAKKLQFELRPFHTEQCSRYYPTLTRCVSSLMHGHENVTQRHMRSYRACSVKLSLFRKRKPYSINRPMHCFEKLFGWSKDRVHGKIPETVFWPL